MRKFCFIILLFNTISYSQDTISFYSKGMRWIILDNIKSPGVIQNEKRASTLISVNYLYRDTTKETYKNSNINSSKREVIDTNLILFRNIVDGVDFPPDFGVSFSNITYNSAHSTIIVYCFGNSYTGWVRFGQYKANTPCVDYPIVKTFSGSEDQTIEIDYTGLNPNTKYYQCIEATSSAGTNGVSDMFTTTFPSPAITINNATNITQTSAYLSGTINGYSTFSYIFFLSEDNINWTNIYSNSSSGTANVYYTKTGLLPQKLYYYKIQATNSAGTSTSSIKTFTTLGDFSNKAVYISNFHTP